jgi:hypothetical protein
MKNEETKTADGALEILHSAFFILHFPVTFLAG